MAPLAVPIAAPAWFAEDLLRLNAQGACAMALMKTFPQDAGPASNGQGITLWRTYQARLSDLRKGIGIPVNVAVMEADLAPRSYFTDANAIGNTGAIDQFGDCVNAEPAFTRGKLL